jgi:hypothetical protein
MTDHKLNNPQPFSNKLDLWLKSDSPKTLAAMNDVFAEKSFAISFLLLMSIPSLPIPTGGITHVFEAITILLAIEQIIGLRTIWTPRSLGKKEIPLSIIKKALPFLIRRIKWFEKYSRPRFSKFLANPIVNSMFGIIILGLALIAITAVPFSGLDTLPSLGIVFISLGLILEDIVGAIVGILIGLAGVAVIFGLSQIIVNLIH